MERRGMVYAILLGGGFLAVLILTTGGLWLYHANGNFYNALKGQFHRGFYLSAILLFVFSSVLYTPFSYGISHYFLLAAKKKVGFRDVFFLFRRPILLSKATVVALLKKALVWLERLFLLLFAAILEVLMFFFFLVVDGQDVFSVEGPFFQRAAEFMLGSPWLIGLSVSLWCGVLLGMVLIWLRYLLCKYVLLCYPDAGILQTIRVGRSSMHYLRLLGYLTANCSFSVYAAAMVEEGWREYCRKRSLR
ncbi:MAG: hypothetical protein IJP27_03945 [Clostridia bacterium]|nr:hypothetical protein [Clostridia bacterium]